MDGLTKLRYQACVATPLLWTGSGVSPFKQIELPEIPEGINETGVFSNQRLGKLVEAFVFHQLQQQAAVTWICDNLQIQEEQLTVGEIDALYYEDEVPVHLEVAYKFYLLDTLKNHEQPLANWIGPNRKDNLFFKLAKLHHKQFPLLHKRSTKPYLDSFHLDPDVIVQKLCFKAQLYLPYSAADMDISPLNSDCIAGFYIAFHQLTLFSALEFYLPTKLDWLLQPYDQANWIDYPSALKKISAFIQAQRSPMLWIKHLDGQIDKCFVVFW